jgi:hypothetical protein
MNLLVGGMSEKKNISHSKSNEPKGQTDSSKPSHHSEHHNPEQHVEHHAEHSSEHHTKHHPEQHSHQKKKMHWFWKLIIAFLIIILIAAGALFYIYKYQPASWASGTSFVKEKFGSSGSKELNLNDVKIEEESAIPEEYYEGHKAEAGEITIEEAQAKIADKFTIEEDDLLMAWPEKIKAGEWIWESDMALGPVGKLASDAWLFWADKEYGSTYPHPTYYIAVYGDGFTDIFVGSFTPKVGEDDWMSEGTKAQIIQEGTPIDTADIEDLQIEDISIDHTQVE